MDSAVHVGSAAPERDGRLSGKVHRNICMKPSAFGGDYHDKRLIF
jgi:hypothetical protein